MARLAGRQKPVWSDVILTDKGLTATLWSSETSRHRRPPNDKKRKLPTWTKQSENSFVEIIRPREQPILDHAQDIKSAGLEWLKG